MISNYLKVILRNLARQKAFAFINVFGLTIGLIGFIVIFLYIRYEVEFDRYHKKVERVYMVFRDVHLDNNIYNFTPVPYPFRDEIVNEFPEVEKATRIDAWNRFLFQFEEKTFDEPVTMADKDIFDIFTFDLVEGNAANPLPNENSVSISRKTAVKYFGDESAIGKVFHVNGKDDFTVTSVFENLPANVSVRYDIILPLEYHRKLGQDLSNWGMNAVNMIVLLHQGTDAAEFQKKLEPKLAQHQASDKPDKLFLHPFKDVHLHNFHYKGGAIQFVYLFSIIGVVILALAGINYVNLVTARSVRRAKEIGIRKTVGASKAQVILQFLGESVLLAIVALNFAVLAVELLLPFINPVIGKELALDYTNPAMILTLIGIAVATGLLAGLYPSFYLSRFSPSTVLKGSSMSGRGTFKSALVIVQFSVSITLIITSIVLYKQLVYLKTLPTGLAIENVLFFKLEDEPKRSIDGLRTSLGEVPGVSEVAIGGHLPSEIFSNGGGYNWEGKDPDQDVLISSTWADDGYLDAFGIRVLEGRYFGNEEITSDTINKITKVVINNRMSEIIGFDEPVGKMIQGGDWRFEIVGVVSDFNFVRMRSDVGPLMIFYSPQNGNFGFVRVDGDTEEVKRDLEKTYAKLFPQLPPDFRLYRDHYDNYFGNETQNARIFGYFTLLAIVISCLGLYGLASYIAEQRRKEMGIRKALGANTAGLSVLMLKDFGVWILIANAIAIPLAWYYASDLLSKYAFRTEISYWVFLLAAVASIAIAGITVVFQVTRTAGQNPASVLKYE
jgi:predicted permease